MRRQQVRILRQMKQNGSAFAEARAILELENGRFKEAVRSAIWWNPRFYYIGRSARGLDLRLHYFKGARLKAPK